ncbi:MAG: TetR/AcrR family transcriptional regulator [Mycobacterium sp.]|nr:TetR/AcrR family transcriptional regulator [Mycobacterium sp.]
MGDVLPADSTGTRRSRGPSPHKTAKTRAAIAHAALELFLERGYRAARISDVADRAGVAKGTVYLHFADKQALFTGVISSVLEQRIGSLTTAQPEADESLRDFLGRVFTPLLTAIGQPPWSGLIRLVMTEGREAPEIAATYRQHVLDPLAEQIHRWARTAADRGELGSDTLQRDPLLLLSPAILATMWNGLFPEEPIQVTAIFESFLDLAFGPRR